MKPEYLEPEEETSMYQAAQHADQLERRRRCEDIISNMRINLNTTMRLDLSRSDIDFLEIELGLRS